ncbi:MAG: hypothetical protein IOD15_00675 [Phycisphaerales bacterium]|nr:hypothetical protein [Phycisphaerales bacterium]
MSSTVRLVHVLSPSLGLGPVLACAAAVRRISAVARPGEPALQQHVWVLGNDAAERAVWDAGLITTDRAPAHRPADWLSPLLGLPRHAGLARLLTTRLRQWASEGAVRGQIFLLPWHAELAPEFHRLAAPLGGLVRDPLALAAADIAPVAPLDRSDRDAVRTAIGIAPGQCAVAVLTDPPDDRAQWYGSLAVGLAAYGGARSLITIVPRPPGGSIERIARLNRNHGHRWESLAVDGSPQRLLCGADVLLWPRPGPVAMPLALACAASGLPVITPDSPEARVLMGDDDLIREACLAKDTGTPRLGGLLLRLAADPARLRAVSAALSARLTPRLRQAVSRTATALADLATAAPHAQPVGAAS